MKLLSMPDKIHLWYVCPRRKLEHYDMSFNIQFYHDYPVSYFFPAADTVFLSFRIATDTPPFTLSF